MAAGNRQVSGNISGGAATGRSRQAAWQANGVMQTRGYVLPEDEGAARAAWRVRVCGHPAPPCARRNAPRVSVTRSNVARQIRNAPCCASIDVGSVLPRSDALNIQPTPLTTIQDSLRAGTHARRHAVASRTALPSITSCYVRSCCYAAQHAVAAAARVCHHVGIGGGERGSVCVCMCVRVCVCKRCVQCGKPNRRTKNQPKQ